VGARARREDFADDVAGENVGEGGGKEADVTGSLVVGVYFCWCWLVDLVWFGGVLWWSYGRRRGL
jgi:hypothetical protein